LAELLNPNEVRSLLSDEHFSVDGTRGCGIGFDDCAQGQRTYSIDSSNVLIFPPLLSHCSGRVTATVWHGSSQVFRN
jgi:hypothetical protein